MTIKIEFCSFGKREDPCGPVEWTSHESSMVPLRSCQCDTSLWLQEKYQGSGASGSGGHSSEMFPASRGSFPGVR